MSRATPDDQLKFLLNCVKHSNNGKIDFNEVAKECGIVSKGAAAKRYERLMKANGIHPNGGPTTTPSMTPPPVAKPRSKAEIARAAAAKKRKIEGASASRMKQDEEEDDSIDPKLESFPQQGAYLAVKAEPGPNTPGTSPKASFALSTDPTAAMEHAPHQQHFGGANSIFEEFCVPEMFAQQSFEEATVKTEQQPQLPQSPQSLQPRYTPPPPSGLVEQIKQSSHGADISESGKGPRESIVIAD